MGGYLVILIVILSLSVYNLVDQAERSVVIRYEHTYQTNQLLSKLRLARQTAISIGIVCIVATSWNWWNEKHGMPEDSVAVAAFIDSSDGIGSIEGGTDNGYCYGPFGGREDSSPCVVLLSQPRVAERPDEDSENWCFEVTYLVETNKVDTGIPWAERTLEAEYQYVSVCGKLEGLDYYSDELVQEKIKQKHGF